MGLWPWLFSTIAPSFPDFMWLASTSQEGGIAPEYPFSGPYFKSELKFCLPILKSAGNCSGMNIFSCSLSWLYCTNSKPKQNDVILLINLEHMISKIIGWASYLFYPLPSEHYKLVGEKYFSIMALLQELDTSNYTNIGERHSGNLLVLLYYPWFRSSSFIGQLPTSLKHLPDSWLIGWRCYPVVEEFLLFFADPISMLDVL